MDIKQLQALGAFKDRRIVPKTIKVKHKPLLPEDQWDEPGVPKYAAETVEDKIDCFIRKRSSADTIEVARAEDRHGPHLMVLRCVVDKEGAQLFPTLEMVVDLEEWFFMPLYNAVSEVNYLSPKPSPPRTSSGARSRSRSGAEALRSGKKHSRTTKPTPGSSSDASTER